MTHSPIFVFGALRSGTTLFRTMLNGHDNISSPGEVDFLFDFLEPDQEHPTGWRYRLEDMQKHRIFREKALEIPADCDGLDLLRNMINQLCSRTDGIVTLNIHRHADQVIDILPEARFIHLLRDPRDVARSSIGIGWAGDSFYGVDHWIATERGWDTAVRCIAPDRILTIRFESLLSDSESELKRACNFLDVPFTLSILNYHEGTTYGPPDSTLAEQWRRKALPHEIALLEGKCGDLITARGYVLNGVPLIPGPLERCILATRNRLYRWRHNIRRFGLLLFVSAHLTRLLGPKTLKDRMQRRMDEKIIEGLK